MLERQSHFSACIRFLLEECTEKSPNTELKQPNRLHLLRARDFIWEYYMENITLDELATVTRLSRFHLVRAFAAEFGMPPHTYLTHLRVARAKELLHRGVRASDVAPQVGFYDQAQLTHHFRRLVGTTPARYGKSRRIRHAPPAYASRRASSGAGEVP